MLWFSAHSVVLGRWPCSWLSQPSLVFSLGCKGILVGIRDQETDLGSRDYSSVLVQTLMNHPSDWLWCCHLGELPRPPLRPWRPSSGHPGKLDGIVSRMRVRVSPWNHLHTSELSSLPIPWSLIPGTSHQRVTIASLSTLRLLPGGGSRLPPHPHPQST